MALALVAGARPNFMKIAPIAKELEKRKLDYKLIHTGQHYDQNMSDVFFTDLKIRRPDYHLGVGSGTNNSQTARVMMEIEPVFALLKPDFVVVVGDVNSTLAATLSAVKSGHRVAHIEAGLRSFDRTMPEEVNRVLTDAVADLLFTTCEDANENLRREGVDRGKIYFVGNVMIDTLVSLMPEIEASPVLSTLGLAGERFMYMTLHRPSNVDSREKLVEIAQALEQVGMMGLRMVFPMHPRTRQNISGFGLMDAYTKIDGLKILEPLSYIESMALVRKARLVLTDSGGLQEETTFLGVPCLTLRPNTERPVTIAEGTNQLLKEGPEMIPPGVKSLLKSVKTEQRMPELWDGKAAQRIVDALADNLR